MGERRRIGVMGGSFNPVHVGHIQVAEHILRSGAADKVLMMLSPQNPLKADSTELIADEKRMEMLRIACSGSAGAIEPCDLELSMPKPSFTIDTLRRLEREHPGSRFRWIIGSDNWEIFDRWRAHDEIIRDFGLIIYPRPGYPVGGPLPGNVELVDAPVCDISSTEIRKGIARGLDMNKWLPAGVNDYIIAQHLYK